MRHCRHSDDCIGKGLGARYQIAPAEALASFIRWRRRLMEGEESWLDRHCSCGLFPALQKKIKGRPRLADKNQQEGI